MLRILALIAATALASACAHQAAHSPPSNINTIGPNPDAPAAVQQFGQLVGQWSCAGENRAQDGSWTPNPAPARWNWYWVLDGYAVQDVWQPGTSAPNAPLRVGTNVRLYDAKAQQWNIIWGTAAQSYWENITAKWQADGRIVMHMERPKGTFNAHTARITFFNITDDTFDWHYEAAAPGTDVAAESGWRLSAKLFCERIND